MMSSLETAATDDHVLHQMQDESTFENSELLTLEDFSLNQLNFQNGIMMNESSDYVTALQECHVLNEIMDDTMNTNSELKMSVVEDSILNQFESEAMNDIDSSVFNGENSTNNELKTNLKRSYEFEDEVATKKKIQFDDEDIDSLMSKGDIIFKSQTISNDNDTIDLTESDHNNCENEIEKESTDDDGNGLETISISDSEDSYSYETSESSESDVDSLENNDLKHVFSDESFDNTLSTNLKKEFFKKYPKLLNYIKKDDIIFHEFQQLCDSSEDLNERLRTILSSGDKNRKKDSKLDFFFNREEKWRKIYLELSQRLKESITVIKHYEKNMENVGCANPHAVKKTIGLQIEFHSEKEKGLQSQLEEHVNKEVFDSAEPLCSNTVEKKHPAPLPFAPKHKSLESWNKVPPSLTLTVQNCPESRDQKAIALRWNLNINNEELTEIICYQIFSYQEISSEIPTSSLWKKIAEVHALPLPMICTLSFESLKSGTKHYFAIRAVNKNFCMGPFSIAQIIEFN